MTASMTEVLEYVRLAPSVHNTQPWHFKVEASTISLFAEPTRALDAGDPTTRELWVSLGICLETILLAAKGLGFDTTIAFIQTEKTAEEIARIQLTPSSKKQPDLLELIKDRHSYRGPMVATSISSSLVESWQQTIEDIPNVSLVFVDEPQQRARVAEIADKGMRLALSSAKFRRELAPLLNYNWSPARIGLHGFVMNHGLLGSVWEKWSVILGLDNKRKAHADHQKVMEASGLLFILSKGDVPSFWLDVGRAYMRLALEITRAGLVHSTITAPVEAARFHEDIENMLGTSERIQSMIRVGKAAEPTARRSPRLTVEELLT